MYTCERLGENATEFKYAPIDGGHSGGGGGAWIRAAAAVAGASLLAQVITQSNTFYIHRWRWFCYMCDVAVLASCTSTSDRRVTYVVFMFSPLLLRPEIEYFAHTTAVVVYHSPMLQSEPTLCRLTAIYRRRLASGRILPFSTGVSRHPSILHSVISSSCGCVARWTDHER